MEEQRLICNYERQVEQAEEINKVCVVCGSALPLHAFIRDFIRTVYLGQVIYSIEANISQATKSTFCSGDVHIHSFISGMHHCECVVLNVDIILQSGQF